MKDKIREITITEVTNGYLVRIGCCQFVFKQSELLEGLAEYIREPRKTEIKYMKEYGIRDDTPVDDTPVDDTPVNGVQPQTAMQVRGGMVVGSEKWPNND